MATDDHPLCFLHRDLTDEQALALGRLMASTWVKPEKDAAYRAASLLKLGAEASGPDKLASRSWALFDGDDCIAHAAMQPREIGTESGTLWIMGLGAVCSSPEHRGEGLGARIVKAAFSVVDDGLVGFSLFQTSHAVRPFYEKLSAKRVDNRVVNSRGEDPDANPFWDEVVMRYPAGDGWPEGEIDLNGPGY